MSKLFIPHPLQVHLVVGVSNQNEAQAQAQTQNQNQPMAQKVELLEKLRDAAKKLGEYKETFKEWVATFNWVLSILKGEYVQLNAVIDVKHDGTIRIMRVDLPRYVIELRQGEYAGIPISDFTRAELERQVRENLDGIINDFIRDLSLYAQSVYVEIDTLIEKISCAEKEDEDEDEE